MRNFFTLILVFFRFLVFSQADHNGNPVFNSITLSEETTKNFILSSNYYTLKNNIDKKTSSVYISDNPTLNDIENAAVNLPSDFFALTKNQSLINLILIRNTPSRVYFVINTSTGEKKEYPCKIKGDISENRANEIIKQGYDPEAKIKNGKLFFNGKRLSIASNENIKADVLRLIQEQQLDAGNTSSVKLLSKEDMKKIVLTESKEGGKLDFFTAIKGHEYDGVQVKPGVITSKKAIALYKWGQANFDLGVNSIEDVVEFWEEFKGRKINEMEKEIITNGFNRKFE